MPRIEVKPVTCNRTMTSIITFRQYKLNTEYFVHLSEVMVTVYIYVKKVIQDLSVYSHHNI